MCNPTVAKIFNPIGAISQAIGGPAGMLFDPVGTVHRKVGGAISDMGPIGKVVGGIVDPDRILDGRAFAPETPQPSSDGGVQTVGGPASPGSVPYNPPTANTYAQAQGPNGLNTYVLGVNKNRGSSGQFSTTLGEEEIGPFNQGGQKVVKKVTQ